jgi:hypothetical protein
VSKVKAAHLQHLPPIALQATDGRHAASDSRKPASESAFGRLSCAGQSAPSHGSGSVTCPEAGLELDAQFGQGLPRRECIGEESDEFRVIATCRQFGN